MTAVGLAGLLESLPDAAWLIDRDGSVLQCNQAAEARPTGALGHVCGGVADQASCPACRREEVLRRGGFERWNVAVPRGDGSDLRDFVEVTLCPLCDDAGQVDAVLEIVRDANVTVGLEQFLIGESERHQAEAGRLQEALGDLRESQAALLYQDRLRALAQLVAGLAHEIRTPLGAIVSSADTIQRAAGRLSTAETHPREHRALTAGTQVIAEGAQRIGAALSDLEFFSHLDRAAWKPTDLRRRLDATIELLRHRWDGRIRIERDYGDVLPLRCRPDAIGQLLLNLLDNAIHAIAGTGTIRVTVREQAGELVVEIADDGPGIAPAAAARVFELGFTTRATGRGIGLALCRRIVEEHGGRIALDGVPGQGTTVRVHLPSAGPGG